MGEVHFVNAIASEFEIIFVLKEGTACAVAELPLVLQNLADKQNAPVQFGPGVCPLGSVTTGGASESRKRLLPVAGRPPPKRGRFVEWNCNTFQHNAEGYAKMYEYMDVVRRAYEEAFGADFVNENGIVKDLEFKRKPVPWEDLRPQGAVLFQSYLP